MSRPLLRPRVGYGNPVPPLKKLLRAILPVDASEAKKKGMADAYFGTIPNDRIEFTAGRI